MPRNVMECGEVIAWLESEASAEDRAGLIRYGIPTENALGVPMRTLKDMGKRLGRSHQLAGELWDTGWYEARILAAFVEEPSMVTGAQMDRWARDFNSWAICDTVCFHLFDRTPFAWEKVAQWAAEPDEFVRRAGYALLWALSSHDKTASDAQFVQALGLIEHAEPDSRPLIKKAIDMALRATGKRNDYLRKAAIEVAEKLADSADKDRAWIGRHALRELAGTGTTPPKRN
jgi:3-methyladenine DNA glycosylase AlkD